jgi:hypothetical protein
MKYFYPILFTLLSGCAMGDDIECDFVSEGLCVDEGDYYIDTEMVYRTINFTEMAVNKFYPGLNLGDLLDKYNVKVKYISKEEMKREHHPSARGIYYSNGHAIYVAQPDRWDEDWQLCVENYYVLGHELEHFIFEEYLDGSEEDSFDHNTDLFLDWVFQDEENRVSTESAEFYIYMDVLYRCKELDK